MPQILLADAWKSYRMREGLAGRLRRLLGRAGRQDSTFWALREVGLSVEPGETVGIVGRNGAGKSTLLKVLAGVTRLTRGRVEVRGSVFPMIELNAGLHRELTGRENVHLLGAIMGIGRREIRRRMGSIEEFCELGSFFDEPVRKYSSGMLARLGFAVAVNVEADILLVDEVLAVGDAAFQQKCYARLMDLIRRGTTLLLVSHAYRQVGRLCDRTLWIDEGRVRAAGPSDAVLLAYMNHLQERVEHGPAAASAAPAGPVAVRALRVQGGGEPPGRARFGGPAEVEIEIRSDAEVADAFVYVQVLTQDQVHVSSFTSRGRGALRLPAGLCRVRCRVDRLPFLPGVYLLNAGVGVLSTNQKLERGNLQVPLSVVAADYAAFEEHSGYVHVEARFEDPAPGAAP